MKKIAVITTGGTIGSSTQGGVIQVSGRRHPMIGQVLEGLTYDLFSPLSLLSENAVPETWNRIVRFLRSLNTGDYSGLIVMHGTDTLCYTAAAAAYLMCDTPIPIVLVSAAYEPDDPRSNARINLQGAADFIRTGGVRGVFAAYSNGAECEIHLASRLEEISDYGARLRSWGAGLLGTIQNRRFQPARGAEALLQAAAQAAPPLFSPNTPLTGDVLLIKAYPGLNYSRIDPRGSRAILHALYHSGTGRTHGEHSLMDFIRQCTRLGIPSYFTPAHRGDPYLTTRQVMDAGAIPLTGIGTPAAYVKLVYFYHTPGLSPDLLRQSLCLDVLE